MFILAIFLLVIVHNVQNLVNGLVISFHMVEKVTNRAVHLLIV